MRHSRSHRLRHGVAASAVAWSTVIPFAVAVAAQNITPPTPAIIATVDREDLNDSNQGASVKRVSIEAQPLSGVSARAAALLLSDRRGGGIDGAMIWTSDGSVTEGGRVPIHVFIEVAGGDLLADTRVFPVRIDVYGYVTDPEGSLVSHLSQSLVLEDPHQARQIRNTGLKFVCELDVPQGVHQFRVLILNRRTNRYFLDGCDLGIPGSDPTQAFLMPPLVAEPADSWAVGLQKGLRPAALLGGLPGMTSWPSAAPVWELGQKLEIVLGGSELTVSPRLSIRLFDTLEQPILDSDIEIGPVLTEMNGLFFYRASVAPLDVSIGEYRFAVVLTGADSVQTVSPLVPVLIHGQDLILAWTDPAAPRVPKSVSPSLSTQRLLREGLSENDASESETLTIEADPLIFDCPTDDAAPPLEPIEIIPLGGVGARGAALLLSGQSGGEVDGAVIWTTSGRVDISEQVSVQFMVEIDGRSLLAGSPHPTIPIEVYGYLLDGTGAVAGHLADGILLDDCRQGLMIEQNGLKFVGDVDVAPGLYSFRVLVRNRLTRRFFLARRDLDIRFEDPLQMILLPPLVAEPRDSWVMVGGRGEMLESVLDEIPGVGSWPSAMPAWRNDEALEMVLGCSELVESRHVSARLYDRFGNPVLDPDVEVNREVSSGRGLTFYSVSVAAPDVPIGEYRFEVSVNDADRGQTVSQFLPMLVHDRDTEIVWTDPAAPRTSISSPTPFPKDQPTPEDLEMETMRAAYTEVLRMWSEGEVVEARRKLAELEYPLESIEASRGWRQLVTVERLTALTLAKSRPLSLMAVALLHRDMHGWYLARRETLLAQHSWRMAAMIARVAPEIDGWNRPVDFSECLLLDLASRLARAGDRHSARQLLEFTAEIAPDSAAALLGLGALSERSGFPEEAVEELKNLYKRHPDHVEGRLRLAVNRARVGEEKAAEELLRGLLDASYPLWIRTVAYQELGRLLIAEGRIEEAERRLREGVARIPGNQRLQILLAHAIDLAERPREAGVVVDRIEMQGSQQNTSPRYRYSAWPDLEAERVRSTLDEARRVGADALREVLP